MSWPQRVQNHFCLRSAPGAAQIGHVGRWHASVGVSAQGFAGVALAGDGTDDGEAWDFD